MIELKAKKLVATLPRKEVIRQVFRAGGPGGQHQNKTESAVRYIHIKTGISAESRSERSQHQNDEIAMRALISKLEVIATDKLEAGRAANYKAKPDASYGSQLRSYFLDKEQRVIDHRTGERSTRPAQVLRGEIDAFIGSDMRARI